MPKEQVERLYPVYECGVNPLTHLPSGPPISYEDAAHMVKHWVAKWVNKCRGIQMLQGKAAIKVRDRSAQMGPRVCELATMGNTAALVIVAAWGDRAMAADYVYRYGDEYHALLASEMDDLEAEQIALIGPEFGPEYGVRAEAL